MLFRSQALAIVRELGDQRRVQIYLMHVAGLQGLTGALEKSAAAYEDAVALISAHEYANGTAIFTQDGDAARDFAARIEVGMVGVNVPIPVPLGYHTFGGWKRSSFGDLNQHGPDGFRFWTRTKTVTARWPSGIRSGADFVIPTMK